MQKNVREIAVLMQDKEKEYKICEKLRRQPELSDLKILCREQLQSFEPVEPFKQFEAEPVEMFNKQLEPLAGRVLLTDLQDTELPEVVKNIPSIGYGFDYRGSAKYVVENIYSIDKMYLETVYCRHYKLPLEIAETDRLILREMQLADLDSLYEVYDTLRDCPYIEPLYERTEEEEFTRQYIKICTAFSSMVCGWCSVRKIIKSSDGRELKTVKLTENYKKSWDILSESRGRAWGMPRKPVRQFLIMQRNENFAVIYFYAVIKKIFRQSVSHKSWDLQFMRRILTE